MSKEANRSGGDQVTREGLREECLNIAFPEHTFRSMPGNRIKKLGVVTFLALFTYYYDHLSLAVTWLRMGTNIGNT